MNEDIKVALGFLILMSCRFPVTWQVFRWLVRKVVDGVQMAFLAIGSDATVCSGEPT